MKSSIAILFALLSSALAFAPQPSNGRMSVAQNALFDRIIGMDLFDKQKSMYGARAKKDLKVGKITDSSYIPSGLTKAQYEKVRKDQKAKKDSNYSMNVKKAGKFLDYTDFYTKRGTTLDQDWKKDINLGHRMAKTKFDWSGKTITDEKKIDSSRLLGKKTVGKKTAVVKKADAAKKVIPKKYRGY